MKIGRLCQIRQAWEEGDLTYDDQEELLIALERILGCEPGADPPAQTLDLRLKNEMIRDAKSPPMLEYGKVAFPAADFYDENGKLRVDLDGLAAENEEMVQGAFARAVDAEFKAVNEYADAQDARLATGLYDGNPKPGKIHGLGCMAPIGGDCDCE